LVCFLSSKLSGHVGTHKFHDYFYNGESELGLLHLVAVKHNYNKTISEYLRRFRETRNKCYSLAIREKDLAELAFVGLATMLKDRMEGQKFTYVNHFLQQVLAQENRAKEHKAHSQFNDTSVKEKPGVNFIKEDSASENDVEVCVAEWIDTPKDKLLACLFLRPSQEREMKSNLYST
jgi:hypothetical protein